MADKIKTIQVLADILNFESNESDLKNTLSRQNMDWDNLVKIGSAHLILPTIYCRLRDKDCLSILPKDLSDYLEELTILNRNRNIELLKQCKKISDLFEAHHIKHSLLKGTALITGNYYNDIAERMIGDIDILVEYDSCQTAHNLLLEHGYDAMALTFGTKYSDPKHLPRLVPSDEIGAVEIHKKLLVKPYKNLLNPSLILENSKIITNFSIPSKEDLLTHNILNFQLNDSGAYYSNINLRSLYDTIIILNTFGDRKKWINNPEFGNYFLFASTFFKEFELSFESLRQRIKNAFLKHD